jgi:hypothetical protein
LYLFTSYSFDGSHVAVIYWADVLFDYAGGNGILFAKERLLLRDIQVGKLTWQSIKNFLNRLSSIKVSVKFYKLVCVCMQPESVASF